MAQNFTQNITQGNLTQGNSRDQLINARAHINELQNTLFKTGGSYTCPTTYANTTQDAISTLTRAMGVSQHHDAISGTEKQHVANDYAKRLSIGIEKSKVVVAEAYNSSFHVVEFCQLLNISECLAIEGIDYFAVMFWNPLAHPVVQWVRLPVTLSNYSVFNVNTMEYTDSENMTIYNETKAIPGRQSKANSTLLFKAELPPFGDSVFIITNKLINKQEKKEPLKPKDDYSLRNKYLSLEFLLNFFLIYVKYFRNQILSIVI